MFLQIDRSQLAGAIVCFDASQIGKSPFLIPGFLIVEHRTCSSSQSAGERGPHNDARMSDRLDAGFRTADHCCAVQCLQTCTALCCWVAEAGWGDGDGRGRPANGSVSWSEQWLACLACFSVLDVLDHDTDSSGCWRLGPALWALSRHSWMPWPQREIIPIRDARYSWLASEIPANWRESGVLGWVAQCHCLQTNDDG